MSFVVTAKIFINDLGAFTQACQKFNLHLDVSRKTFDAHTHDVPCDARIKWTKHPDAYQMGLVRSHQMEDGTIIAAPNGDGWTVSHDEWNGGNGMVEHVGRDCGLLMQEYGLVRAEQQAISQGYSCERHQMENGEIKLVATENAW